MKRPSRRLLILLLPALAILFVGLVWLGSGLLRGARVDLTENHLYTLSEGTQHILDRIEKPVTMELFYSEQAAQGQPQFRIFAQRARELLEEMASRSHGKVVLKVTDPQPFSDAEDRATGYGLQGVPLGDSGDKLYFGLVGSNGGKQQSVMPFLQPAKEAFLEYDLAKMLSTLSSNKRPVLAVLSSLPMGPGIDAATGQPTPGWVMDRQLQEFFEIRRLQPDPTSFGTDVDLLMLVHPKHLAAQTEYAIDQYVLRGGHLLVFVDPEAETDSAGRTLGTLGQARSSDMASLFKAWGLVYDPNKVVLDGQNAMRFQPNPNQPAVRHLGIIGLHRQEMNSKDVITADLETVNLGSAGSLSLSPNATASLEALLQSSSASSLVDAETVRDAEGEPGLLADGFRQDGKGPYVLAARLGGVLKSAFPNRAGPGHLGASVKPANIIVVADTDLLTDKLWVQGQNFLGQQILDPFANNADFVYNAVDNLVGNDDLIQVRTRPTATRPFERIDAIRRSAEVRYQAKARQLEEQLAELEQKLERLQPMTGSGKPQALSREQQSQLLQFQKQKLRTRKELRSVQLELNSEIETIGTRLKLINILAVPVLVLLFALLIALRRYLQRRDAAG